MSIYALLGLWFCGVPLEPLTMNDVRVSLDRLLEQIGDYAEGSAEWFGKISVGATVAAILFGPFYLIFS